MIKTIKRFITDIKNYWEYIIFAAKSELKNEVAGSFLGWIWWILDPLFFMLVYTFVVQFVFDSGGQDFPIFVFIGLTAWNFLNSTVTNSVRIVYSFRAIISKVYLPKFVLILVRMYKNLIKMGISFILVLILMGFFNISYSWKIIYIIPVVLINIVTTFAISLFVAHVGVFISDSANIVNVVLRFLFYVSGILYSITDRLPPLYQKLIFLTDPIAYVIQAYRDVIMYQQFPNVMYMIYWFVIGIIGSIIFLHIMYKYENTYVKVVQNG
jgi:ABC-type polysaccharide/polyol phosphate export permease